MTVILKPAQNHNPSPNRFKYLVAVEQCLNFKSAMTLIDYYCDYSHN